MQKFNPDKIFKCKVCKVDYKKSRPLQSVCGAKCALVHAKRLEDKKAAKEAQEWRIRKRSEKKALEKTGVTLGKLQRKVNLLIRLIDKGHPCISSGRKSGQMQAGHYWAVGGNSQLRFHLFNIWGQSATDNNYKSGNPVGYKEGIIKTFGEWLFNEIEALKEMHHDIKLMKHEIEAKITIVNDLIKEMNKRHEVSGILSNQERIEYRELFNKKIGIYV